MSQDLPTPPHMVWNEVLDNLGNNLIRLGPGISELSEIPSYPADEFQLAEAARAILHAFHVAIQQAELVLQNGERTFLKLMRSLTGPIFVS